MTIKLVGYGEFYGLICLDASTDNAFSTHVVAEITNVIPALLRTVAEANFSMRLQRLAAPLESPNGRPPTREQIWNHIAKQAALGLAADGAVVRIFEANTKLLVIHGIGGDPGVDPETDFPIRERVCRKVYDSEQGYAVHNVHSGQAFGVPLEDDDKTELGQGGVVSFMILRLQSDVATTDGVARLGTLAVLHHRPHDFSLRDIRLARMFAERVADDLALLNQNDKLEDLIVALRNQYNVITRAEVIALLAHDLGHKAIQITQRVNNFAKICRKAIQEKRSPDFIDRHAAELTDACNIIENEIAQIKRISYKADEPSVIFDLRDLLDEVYKTMRQVLDRNSMDIDLQAPKGLQLYGPRGIFGQAIFNLIINSVDAQRSLPKQRKNDIHILARKEVQGDNQKVIIQFSDDGPGINYQHFPNMQDIFKIGTTSKSDGQGTGTGLPISRSLLDKYFRAELDIRDRRPPRFEIVVPIKTENRKN